MWSTGLIREIRQIRGSSSLLRAALRDLHHLRVSLHPTSSSLRIFRLVRGSFPLSRICLIPHEDRTKVLDYFLPHISSTILAPAGSNFSSSFLSNGWKSFFPNQASVHSAKYSIAFVIAYARRVLPSLWRTF